MKFIFLTIKSSDVSNISNEFRIEKSVLFTVTVDNKPNTTDAHQHKHDGEKEFDDVGAVLLSCLNSVTLFELTNSIRTLLGDCFIMVCSKREQSL